MKTIAKWVLTGVLLCVSLQQAKSQSGIYMSAADFKNDKLTYASDCHKEKNKMHLHSFFYNAPTITIVHENEKHTLKKSDLYGFRDCKNEVYRFYKNTPYRIAETGGIYIYTQQQNIAMSKGFRIVNVYYFSSNAEGNIMPLTISNLKNAYRNNNTFLDLLYTYFGSSDVTEYDAIHKTYKVNYLYSKTIIQ